MTKWNKDNFNYSGGYLTYDMEDDKGRQFVARFKYRGGLVPVGMFKKALIKSNLTPAQYFDAMADHDSTPMGILEKCGALVVKHDWTGDGMSLRITKTSVYIAGKLIKVA